MKRFIIIICSSAIALLAMFSCKDHAASPNLLQISKDSVNSKLLDKWQLMVVYGGFAGIHDVSKDSNFLQFSNNNTYTFYQKDSLPFSNTYELKWDKSQFQDDSAWIVVFHGLPVLIIDKSYPSDTVVYKKVDYMEKDIITISDTALDLDDGNFRNHYTRVKIIE